MPAQKTKKLKKQIEEALVQAKNDLPELQDKLKGKDIVVFLGNTRSGKSTIVNYLLETDLEAVEQRTGVYKIKKAGGGNGPDIGQGALSNTSMPGFFPSRGLVLVDMPGFHDNRSEAQDIINAVYLSQVRHSQTCKFVLVCDVNDIAHDNIAGFLTSIRKVNELMPNIENIRNSISLVFTKVSSGYTREEIVGKIREEIIANAELNIVGNDRKLIRCFVENEELIAFFKMPNRAGVIPNDIGITIREAIKESSPLEMSVCQIQTGCPITNKVRVILFDICETLNKGINFNEKLEEVTAKFHKFLDEDYLSASSDEELLQAKTELAELSRKLDCHDDAMNLQTLLDSLRGLIMLDSSAELYKALKLFAIMDEVNLINSTSKNTLAKKFTELLQRVQSKVDEIKSKVGLKEEEMTSDARTKIIAGAVSATVATAGVGSFATGILATGTVALAATGIGVVLIAGGGIAATIIGGIHVWQSNRKTRQRQDQNRPI